MLSSRPTFIISVDSIVAMRLVHDLVPFGPFYFIFFLIGFWSQGFHVNGKTRDK